MSRAMYLAWADMKKRCNNPGYYASNKGIVYDPRWQKYQEFYNDMRSTWKPGLVLDRRNNNGHYDRDNCQWITMKESNRNRSNVLLNEEKAQKIRELYSSGKYTQKKIGEMFNVNRRTVNYVLSGKLWA